MEDRKNTRIAIESATSCREWSFTRQSLGATAASTKCFAKIKKEECYHLAARSFVTLVRGRVLDAHTNNQRPDFHVWRRYGRWSLVAGSTSQASSEMFGKVRETPQDRVTPFHRARRTYPQGGRGSNDDATTARYGMQRTYGICTNHESPRRGLDSWTRKDQPATSPRSNRRAEDKLCRQPRTPSA